ncbi:MAG: hypothetical protein IJX40_06530 [Alistipes sp.]|nr:hypothetical protein [Alistipes sp.]MBQ8367374.1 hypothetical protein [Alistipes sp.]
MSRILLKNMGAYIFIVLMLLICIPICLRATRETAQDVNIVNNHLDMPLDKVTIWLKEDIFEEAINKSTWAKIEATPFSSAIKIGPRGNIYDYKSNIDVDAIHKLIDVSLEYEIEMDSNSLLLPTDNHMVLVPTWIVYNLAKDGCFKNL